ncbi:MAG: hypothetical protein FWC38_00730 [Proteobacteria bacterium]|nr:hypothetical protein [Pseudomonadota bacterium]MCL2306767.1 hypothetical protein [Pseudomonadota bacterium]
MKNQEMPQSGGRFVRDPKTGALTKVQGPTPDAEIKKAQAEAKTKTVTGAAADVKGE